MEVLPVRHPQVNVASKPLHRKSEATYDDIFDIPIVLQRSRIRQGKTILQMKPFMPEISKPRLLVNPGITKNHKIYINSKWQELPIKQADFLSWTAIVSHQTSDLDYNLKPRYRLKRSLVSRAARRKNAIKLARIPKKVDIDWRDAFLEINMLINQSNGINVAPGETTFRYYIDKGNNGSLVKKIFAQRWWWVKASNKDKAHFIWTEWKSSGRIRDLPIQENEEIVEIQASNTLKHEAFVSGYSWSSIVQSPEFHALEATNLFAFEQRILNHLENNNWISNKKALFKTMSRYYSSTFENIFDFIPLTFHIKSGLFDSALDNFEKTFAQFKKRGQSVWILKPGENSNRGNGIYVTNSLREIKLRAAWVMTENGHARTTIIQKYIENPLLIHKRKFDIRWYAMITGISGYLQGYYYSEGYLRTSSKEFDIRNIKDRYIHLTNDAIQNKSDAYGKHEPGNKLNYAEFDQFLKENKKGNFYQDVEPQIKKIVTDTIRAASSNINPARRLHTFEIFGYDFMVDSDLRVWLIEINTNPWLSISSSCLERIIPHMLDNAFRIAVDPLFLERRGLKKPPLQPLKNKFQLVYSDFPN